MENDNDRRLKANYSKAKYFFENNIPVHLIKYSREWLNGPIEEFNEDSFIINEYKKGRRIVFLIDIYDIDEMIKEDISDQKILKKVKDGTDKKL